MIKTETRVRLLTYGVVLLAVSLFIARFLLSGRVIYWGIPSLQFIPWRWEAWNQIREGTLPLWNGYNGFGAPLLANYQLALFYPPSWILYLFAGVGGLSWLAWAETLLVLLHLVWAGWGMVKLCEVLGLTKTGQLIAGLAFALGGYLAARTAFFSIIWSAAWIPWCLFSIEKWVILWGGESQDRAYCRSKTIFPVIIFTMLFLTGHAQLTVYTLEWGFAWLVFRSGIRGSGWVLGRNVLTYGAILFGAAILSAIQLLPTLEYLSLSSRSTAVDFNTAISYSFLPWKLITIISPSFFGNPGNGTYWGYGNYWEDAIYLGIIPLCLAISTIFIKRPKQNQPNHSAADSIVPFLWVSVIVAFTLAMGKNTPIFPFLYEHIPTFNMFNAPARYLVIAAVSLTLLAAVGLGNWRRPVDKCMYWFRLATAGGAALTIGAILAAFILRDVELTFVRSMVVTGGLFLLTGLFMIFKPVKQDGLRHQIWTVAVVAVVVLDLLSAHWKLVPVTNMSYFKSSRTPTYYRPSIEEPRIYLNIRDDYLLKYQRFLRFEDYRRLEDQAIIQEIPLPNANLLIASGMINNFDPLVSHRYQKFIEALELEDHNGLVNLLGWMNVDTWQRLDITRVSGIAPKMIIPEGIFSWYPCAEYVDTEQAAFTATMDLHRNKTELTDTIVILEAEDADSPKGDCSIQGKPVIELIEQSASHRTIRISAKSPGWLVVKEMNYPGWQSHVDGGTVPIITANYLFLGVYVPAGEHQIKYLFIPQIFLIGSGISIIGWVILATLLVIISNWRKTHYRKLETVDDN